MFAYCDRVLKELFFFCGFFFLLLGLFFLYKSPLFVEESFQEEVSLPTYKKRYDPLGNVFFPSSFSFVSLPNLYEEIKIYQVFPHVGEEKEGFLLFFLKSQEKKKVFFSEKISLFYDEKGELCFSEKPTGFWILPRREKEKVVVESVLEDPFCPKEESFTFPLLKGFSEGSWDLSPYIEKLTCLGKDLWVEKKGREVFVFEREGKFFFLPKSSLWIFEKGVFKEKKEEEEFSLLIRLKEEKKEGISLEFWGKEGQYKEVYFLFKPFKEGKNFFSEIEPKIYPHNFHKVAFCFSDKLLLLKEKESLCKTFKGWEKNAFEEGKEPGEIFFFDKIEWKAKEKVVHAELFDFTHTKKQKVLLSFEAFTKKSSFVNSGGN